MEAQRARAAGTVAVRTLFGRGRTDDDDDDVHPLAILARPPAGAHAVAVAAARDAGRARATAAHRHHPLARAVPSGPRHMVIGPAAPTFPTAAADRAVPFI